MDWSIDGVIAIHGNAIKGRINSRNDIPQGIKQAIHAVIDASGITGGVRVTAQGRAGDASHPAFLQVTVEAFDIAT